MKVSIITVTYNSAFYLEDTISSIRNQIYSNIEYIVVDGGSTDRTLEIINNNKDIIKYYISEKDNGIYDAMNKGIKLATGEIIGFLNSDDFFYDDKVINNIVDQFTDNIDCIFGNVVFVKPANLDKYIRLYSSKNFKISQFKLGQMPAHPSFYARSVVYKNVGNFKTNYKIAADFDFLLRVLVTHKYQFKYLNFIFVKMRIGGVSTSLKNKIILNNEILRSCRENNLYTNYLLIYSKYFKKIFSYFN